MGAETFINADPHADEKMDRIEGEIQRLKTDLEVKIAELDRRSRLVARGARQLSLGCAAFGAAFALVSMLLNSLITGIAEDITS